METQHSSPTVPPARLAAPEAACRSERLWTSLRAQWLGLGLGLCHQRKTREHDTS